MNSLDDDAKAPNVEACAQSCTEDSSCLAFSYTMQIESCLLYRGPVWGDAGDAYRRISSGYLSCRRASPMNQCSNMTGLVPAGYPCKCGSTICNTGELCRTTLNNSGSCQMPNCSNMRGGSSSAYPCMCGSSSASTTCDNGKVCLLSPSGYNATCQTCPVGYSYNHQGFWRQGKAQLWLEYLNDRSHHEASVGECVEKCSSDSGCAAFSYTQASQSCLLNRYPKSPKYMVGNNSWDACRKD